jgi:hypothetical protein
MGPSDAMLPIQVMRYHGAVMERESEARERGSAVGSHQDLSSPAAASSCGQRDGTRNTDADRRERKRRDTPLVLFRLTVPSQGRQRTLTSKSSVGYHPTKSPLS